MSNYRLFGQRLLALLLIAGVAGIAQTTSKSGCGVVWEMLGVADGSSALSFFTGVTSSLHK